MKRKIEIVLILMLLLTGIYAGTRMRQERHIQINYTYIRNECNAIHYEEQKEQSPLEIAKQIARRVAKNHTYIKYKFDCKHFSTAVANELNDSGYDCWCVMGIYKSGKTKSLHEWIRCRIDNETWNIEATTGSVFRNSEHYIYKKDIDCDWFNYGKRRWRQ